MDNLSVFFLAEGEQSGGRRHGAADHVHTRGQADAGSKSRIGRAGSPLHAVFLLGFAFANRDDLEIVADRFQNKCFVNRAGRICRAVA
jgi:hypothetical protein